MKKLFAILVALVLLVCAFGAVAVAENVDGGDGQQIEQVETTPTEEEPTEEEPVEEEPGEEEPTEEETKTNTTKKKSKSMPKTGDMTVAYGVYAGVAALAAAGFGATRK